MLLPVQYKLNVAEIDGSRAVFLAPPDEFLPQIPANRFADLALVRVHRDKDPVIVAAHPEQATVAMLLNAGMQKISVETVAPLDYASAGVRADTVISHAMAHGASVVVMAHNHPHGAAYPTHGDIITSQVMQKEFTDCGLLLLEHYVVCGREFVGFHHRFGVHEGMDEAVCRFLVSKEELAK